MEDAIKSNPDNFCRACLIETPNMASLERKINGKNRTLADVLSFVVNTNIQTVTKYPNRICSDCEAIMLKAEEFKHRCIESQKFISNIFKSVVLEPSISIRKVKKESINSKGDIPPLLNHFYNDSNAKVIDTLKIEIADSCDSDDVIARIAMKKAIKDEMSDFSDEIGVDNDDMYNKEMNDSFKCENGDEFFDSNTYNEDVDVKKQTKIKINHKSAYQSIPVKCEWCSRLFKSEKSFNKHKKLHLSKLEETSSEFFQCSLCMRKFKKKSSLIAHIKHHEMRDRMKFVCNTCKREFKHQGHLDNHIIAMHNKDKGLTCEYCLSVFLTEESLELHKNEHRDGKRHRCKICNKAFNMLSTLTDHLRTHTGEKPFLCSVCGRGFSQKTNLVQHMRRHLGLKPFKCRECDRGFVSKGELDAHERKHSGAHPFVCSDCGNGFTTSSSLVKHRRIHTGERPYACDLCPMKFSASGTLKNHRRTHTGEKPYQCSYCEKAFVQRQDLVSHIRCHTGERPYVCNVCGQAFRKAAGLKTHVRMHKDHSDMPGMVTGGVTGFEGS